MFVCQLMVLINQAQTLYNRLVVVVGPAGLGKTRVLREVHERTGAPVVNVNLELSRRMLDLTERLQVSRMVDLLRAIVNAQAGEVVLLDNTEMLFDPAFKQDPLRLLENLSRDRTLVVAWNGRMIDGRLTYAAPDHPEYRRYVVHGFLFVEMERPAADD